MTTRVAGATLRPGPTNTLVDVPKIRVGHATLVGEGMLTGTHGGAHPARGGDWRRGRAGRRAGHQRDRPPGPQNLVERVHAVILTGGSAYGLGDRGRRDANARGGGPRLPRRPGPRHTYPRSCHGRAASILAGHHRAPTPREKRQAYRGCLSQAVRIPRAEVLLSGTAAMDRRRTHPTGELTVHGLEAAGPRRG